MTWTLWPLIVICVLSMVLAAVMWLFARTLFAPEIVAELRLMPEFTGWPDQLWSLIAHMPLLMEVTFVTAVVTLVICIGGLFRHRWAWWSLLACFWSGVPLNLIGIIWHWRLVDDIHPALEALLVQHGLPAVMLDYWAIQMSGVLFGLVFAIGFCLTARQWQAADIKSFFGRAIPAPTPPGAPS